MTPCGAGRGRFGRRARCRATRCPRPFPGPVPRRGVVWPRSASAVGGKMRRVVISKAGPWPVPPNLLDYGRAAAEFSWESARAALDGLPGGRGLNIAHEAVDRHAAGPLRDRLALRFLSKKGERRDYTYAELAEATS